MTDGTGTTLLKWVGVANVRRRVRRWLPRREKWFRIEWGPVWSLLHWRPFKGLWVVSVGSKGVPNDTRAIITPRPKESRMKKRQPMSSANLPPVALPATSVILGKLPALREFLTATAYDDGDMRTPGYMTIRNRVTSFEVTLYDPDAGARMPVRGDTLDAVLVLVEQLLGVAEAPWEHDQYLTDQLTKKKRKKK